jgi:hypothetical protein
MYNRINYQNFKTDNQIARHSTAYDIYYFHLTTHIRYVLFINIDQLIFKAEIGKLNNSCIAPVV